MKKKTTAKASAALKKQILSLTTADMMKMDVAKFCRLRERADADGRKKLDYLFERAGLEYTIRTIVREELAKAAK